MAVPNGERVTAISVEGTGKLIALSAATENKYLQVEIYADGAWTEGMTADGLNTLNVKKEARGWRLLHFDESAGDFIIDYIKEVSFRRKLEIKAYNPPKGGTSYVTIYLTYEKIA